jgi:hypothetical protein
MKQPVWFAVAAGVVCLTCLPAVAQSYSFKTYDRPKSDQSYFLAINKSKAVLEQISTKSGGYGCTLLHGQTATPISVPNSYFTQCEAINNTGTVVGFYQASAGPLAGDTAGFIYSNGAYTTVAGPYGESIYAALSSINNKGEIAGFYTDRGNHQIAFTMRASKYHIIKIAGASKLIPVGFNSAGQITVQAVDMNNNPVNYLLSKSGLVALGYPGATATTIQQLNDNGIAVGSYIDGSNISHGFAYDIATCAYYTIDDPAAAQTFLIGINADETIVGSAILPGNPNNQALIGTRTTQ